MGSKESDFYGVNHVIGKENENRELDIIFVHGLNGHAEKTWTSDNNEFWPIWFGEEFDNIGVWTVGYDSTASSWSTDNMPMEQRALHLLNDLYIAELGNKPLFFIVHSMGGIIVKFLLERASQDTKYSSILDMTKGISFLATPHTGSYGGNFLDALSIIYRANEIVKQLKKNSPSLGRLEDSFCNLVEKEKFKCISFYETKEVRIDKTIFGYKIPSSINSIINKKGLKVVSEESAKGRFTQDTPIPVDRDHINICKLESKEDSIYKSIKKFIEDILSDIDNKNEMNRKYCEIKSNLPDQIKNEESSVNRIFLIFDEDNTISNTYEVLGYIQNEDEFENELIEFTFNDIYDEKEQEVFLNTIFQESQLENVPIHFILPPSLFLVNFKQWRYREKELIKIYPILLHNKEKFSRKISKFNFMKENWDELFDQFKDESISEALSAIEINSNGFDCRDNKIGGYFTFHPKGDNVIHHKLIGANIGVWQYENGDLANYKGWINSGIPLKQLDKESRKCDYMALLWDEMSLLEKLKRKI